MAGGVLARSRLALGVAVHYLIQKGLCASASWARAMVEQKRAAVLAAIRAGIKQVWMGIFSGKRYHATHTLAHEGLVLNRHVGLGLVLRRHVGRGPIQACIGASALLAIEDTELERPTIAAANDYCGPCRWPLDGRQVAAAL